MDEGRPPSPPRDSLAHSRAFREASLRSEVRRAYAVVGVVLLVIVPMLLVSLTQHVDFWIKAAGAVAGGALILVQLCTVAVARWAARRERDLPAWFRVATVVIESAVPTAALAAHLAHGSFPPYTTLLAPPLLAYGLLIGLTTLRLRPALCILAGLLSAGGYVGLLLFVRFGLAIAEPTTGLPLPAYFNVAAFLFISGVAGAWVAREVRAHVSAALIEAEARRRMDRMEQDLAVASSIQRALLPRAQPDIPGFEIAGWNRPADQTGGDYYDWQALPDDRWIVSLADVSGHGIGPALVTAACRAYMRASSAHHDDLAALAARINGLLADDLPAGRFVTMASVLIDPRGGPLALLSAGHGPIVLYLGATGEVSDIFPQDLPLAVEPDVTFGPARLLSLAPGDVLALITDGFVEWARASNGRAREQFGMDRLRDSLRRHAALPAAPMIEAVAADAAAFAQGEKQQDDLTMVVIRRVG